MHRQTVVATFVTTYKGTKLHIIERKMKTEKEKEKEKKQRGKTKYNK